MKFHVFPGLALCIALVHVHRHRRQNLRYNVDVQFSSSGNLVVELYLVPRILRAVRHCLLSNVGDTSTRCNIVSHLSQDVDIKDSHSVHSFFSPFPLFLLI
jgi:hypothetical protein